ncbi:MAG: BolA/IbaG family iron-sulfur metabolism protein [Deltaproteobacteria bacterium]|nr:BolA/IbaG family iron-sulfur metabolism protein [Deltaproteobacteria bacterium]
MLDAEKIKNIVLKKLPGAQVEVKDYTGTGDHFEAVVVWSGFDGKSRVAQHQMVMQALKNELDSGALHALALKTKIRSL